MTIIRNKDTGHGLFVQTANRLMTILIEEGLSYVQEGLNAAAVETPTKCTYNGFALDSDKIVAVSIIRAGDSMLDCFIRVHPEIRTGKILIQRDEETTLPKLFYCKLPNLESKQILLLDPMLATGGSAKVAVEELISHGASEENIIFFNVVSCPAGLNNLLSAYPKMKIVTAEIDAGLNEKAYIIPGLGDYGDRYYGTH
eukprot:gene38272-46507_t